MIIYLVTQVIIYPKEVEYIPRLIEVGFTVKEIAEMMGFGICLVRDYYNNYRNLTQGTHYYIHSKRKNKS